MHCKFFSCTIPSNLPEDVVLCTLVDVSAATVVVLVVGETVVGWAVPGSTANERLFLKRWNVS